jgi:hydrogenase expression/formation protein HypD
MNRSAPSHRYLDEYRDADSARRIAAAIAKTVTRPWTIMEICGGQTHAILRFGLDTMLPPSVRLVHGPGCPVCVTPLEMLDKAILLARRPDITLCTYGDMLRVPGSSSDLMRAKADGGDVRIVYSPLDAVRLAHANPSREFVFFAVGFETTAPAHALAVLQAEQLGLANFSLLVSQVLVPPAIEAILSAPDNQIDGFLAAGHVCAITGTSAYHAIAGKYHVPLVVTGFEPVDLLQGVLQCVRQLEEGRYEVENAYSRIVKSEGNLSAIAAMRRVFTVADRPWRGLGTIPASGLVISPAYLRFDAEDRFQLTDMRVEEPAECQSGMVLQGRINPDACPCFGTTCTPETPLGATMVSSEGACAAYFKYKSHRS